MADTVINERFDNLGSDGASCRLGIMGGTFDPIHMGHLACADEAREECNLNGVLFIPTATPSFKRDQVITPAPLRLDMCQAACASNKFFDVSNIEIARGGITYTVDTLRELRDHYPENVELYMIMGADSLITLPRWRETAVIATLVKIIVVARPGYVVDEALRSQLEDLGYVNITFLDCVAFDVSSSDVRDRVAQGRSIRYLVPDKVCEIIERTGLYRVSETPDEARDEILDSTPNAMPNATPDTSNQADREAALGKLDALSDEFYAARAEEVKTRVSEKRAHHIEGVAQAALDLARAYGVDERRAHLAGLLHDWDKGYDDDGIRARIEELGIADTLNPWAIEHMPQVLHGPTAAAALARDFPNIPADVLQAIRRHTTAAPDMSDLDKILYVADAIEPHRQFGRIDELRAQVGKVSLDELFLDTYGYWTELLIERRKPLHPDTITVWNALTAKNASRKGK